jgi:tetratricopeptide (TPR) repeat protein
LPRIHPKPGLLEGLTGALPEARRRILRHLRDCPVCQAQPAAPPGGRLLAFPSRSNDYDAVLERVLRAFRPRLAAAEREREAAPALLSELLSHPPERRQILLRNSRRFQSLGLCFVLLERSREATPADPRRGEELASLALALAESLDPAPIGKERIEDLRSQGWMLIANSRRARSDLHGAEEAFLLAESHSRQGSGEHLDRAQLFILKACLRRMQSRFIEAKRLLRRALSICLCVGESRRAVEALLSWSLLCEEAGEMDEALDLLQQARRLAGPDIAPYLRLVLQHNLAICLFEKGRLLEAQAILARNRVLYRVLRNPVFELRERWVRAMIAHKLGRSAEAVDLLTAVRDGFLDQEHSYSAALVSLELALMHAEMGDFATAEDLAGQALAVFRVHHVADDALAALIVVRQAAARRQSPPASLAS